MWMLYKFCSVCGKKMEPTERYGFDPNTGEELWRGKCPNPVCCGSAGHDVGPKKWFGLLPSGVTCLKCGAYLGD